MKLETSPIVPDSHFLLAGKRGIVFGVIDECSIAWSVAQSCLREGARIVLSNTENAIKMGTVQTLAEQVGVPLIAADATNSDDLHLLMQKATEILGGKIDFILHSIALSQNVRRHRTYDELNYNYFHTTLDISALSLHRIIRVGVDCDALADGCSVVALTYLASQRFMENYNDMGDAKAMLESVARNLGGIYGEKKGIRVNCISQSPVPSKAGRAFPQMDYFTDFADNMAPLGSASREECASLCVMLFSDYTRKVTMQTIYNDGGFSQSMMTTKFMRFFDDGNK